jgi:hypothetical protein
LECSVAAHFALYKFQLVWVQELKYQIGYQSGVSIIGMHEYLDIDSAGKRHFPI